MKYKLFLMSEQCTLGTISWDPAEQTLLIGWIPERQEAFSKATTQLINNLLTNDIFSGTIVVRENELSGVAQDFFSALSQALFTGLGILTLPIVVEG